MKIKLLLLTFAFASTLYSADEGAVTIDGISIIEENNIAKARISAIDDAHKKAINQFISSLVPSNVLQNNFKNLDEKVFSRSLDFINSYKVVSETIEGNILRVKVDVFLNADALEKVISQLGLAFFRGEEPRVIVMIAEQGMDGKFSWWWNMDEEGVKGICDSVLYNRMKEHNFVTIEPNVVREKIGEDKTLQVMEPDGEVLRRIGKDSGVDIVFYGQARIARGTQIEGSTLRTCDAKLSLRALHIDSGKVIFDDNYGAGGVHTEESLACKNALKKVSDIAGESVIPEVEQFWRDDVLKIKDFFIEIKNKHKLEDVDALLAVVQRIKNVRNAQMKAFSPGSSLIQAEVMGLTADSLASEIMQDTGINQRFEIIARNKDRIIFSIKNHLEP